MEDKSYLDKKYFIDSFVYNCPFCNRSNIRYEMFDYFVFNWTNDKLCHGYLVQCTSCEKISMHLSYDEISDFRNYSSGRQIRIFREGIDIDSKIFYSVPTSFFVIDRRVPNFLRELVTEAEDCLRMNYLTGASACLRKAIYEFLVYEKAKGKDYEKRIKFLKSRYSELDPQLFDILAHIQDMKSDKVREQSWDKWDSNYLNLIIETLKTVFYEIYILPKQKKERSITIQRLNEVVQKEKNRKWKIPSI